MFVGGTLGGYLFICEKVSAALPFLDLHTDPGRTAVGLHLDPEALNWCMENNINKDAVDGHCRMSLFHGNVLQSFEAKLIKFEPRSRGEIFHSL
ncbi:hypothetical protein C1H46_031585 [Malus baccata]|uniref:Uncharacterized protein n=1 Tax=Malus baccata TaxID=106549 RepID=A0A540L8L9_MALBA|nr:hypothetical protein C1H46_031585 [Malus baccata]